jgi:elongation factor P--beta-lysine ligase
LDDYYAGAYGARRLMRELDSLLQHVVDNVEPTETLSCALKLRTKTGELVSLRKIYRPASPKANEEEPA